MTNLASSVCATALETFRGRRCDFLSESQMRETAPARFDERGVETEPRSPRSGRPGRLPTPAPHRSGHAELRHPALPTMTSPVTSRPRPCVAIRSCRVEMGSGPGVPGIVPSSGLMARHLLPSAGSLGSVPPASAVHPRRSDSPSPVPPRFVAFAWRYPGRTCGSLPRPPGASAVGLEFVTRCSRRDLPRRRRDLPGSWGPP